MLNNTNNNANVCIDNIYDNFFWIQGDITKDIDITIFLITINSHHLKYALESLKKLDPNYPVKISVIMNISPTNKAYNMMRKRCDTKYFVQFDDDMELYPHSIKLMYEYINKDNNCFLITFKLIDEYLGVGKNKIIDCIKLYNNDIMKNYPTLGDGDIPISSVDKMWHKPIMEDKYTINQTQNIAGTHAKNRNGMDLLLRFCKSTKSMLNNNIKINSGDLCRLLKPLNKIQNLEETVSSILCHFFALNFDMKKYDENKKLLHKRLSSYISKSSLDLYDLPEKYKIFPCGDFAYSDDDFNKLYKCDLKYSNELFCIIGIINTLFDNYEYSYDKYPYDIYDYFNRVFLIKVSFIRYADCDKDKILFIFDKYKFVELHFDNCDCDLIVNKGECEFDNLAEYVFANAKLSLHKKY